MPLTITVNDELATLLQAQALRQRVPVEEWSLSILGYAATHPHETQGWVALNRRRFALISKQFSVGLDETEQHELAQLQDRVAQLLEPWDRKLIEKLAPYEALVERLSANGSANAAYD